MNNSISIFASKFVGLKTLEFLLIEHRDDLSSIIVEENDFEILSYLQSVEFNNEKIFLFKKNKHTELHNFLNTFDRVDYIILAWWGYIIKDPILSFPKIGIINFHPSLLPYNRGKHYNFWNLVEDVPFGVTIHFVDVQTDTGDIIFQKAIEKTWEDTGETLYYKAQNAMILLFQENYLKLKTHNYIKIPQNIELGSFHLAKELESASQIDLNRSYLGKELINLLRARTFQGYPACYFIDNNQKYEVRISITHIK